MMNNNSKKLRRLVLLDGHAILFRAFHAMPASFTLPDGTPSGAIYGFTSVLLRILKELDPEWIVACFDSVGKTFREVERPSYKATRSETPAGLIAQEPYVHQMLEAISIPDFALTSFEADDIIGTFVEQVTTQDSSVEEVVIVTGDQDLLQLVGPTVKVYLFRSSSKSIELVDEAGVQALIGLPRAQLLDWKALRGDPSDNIAGVPGIGDKTAVKLIQLYGTLESLYTSLAENTGAIEGASERIANSLRQAKDRAFDNRELLTVRRDVPLTVKLDLADRRQYQSARVRALFDVFGFRTWRDRLRADAHVKQDSLF